MDAEPDRGFAPGSTDKSNERAVSITRTPLFFGPGDRSLFGWYHAPADDRQAAMGIVICAPLGHEHINSHRSLRHLADRFAAAGLPALRFDYHGTGDSSGYDEEPQRLSHWLDSVRDAVGAVRSWANVSRVGLVGLRMGATFAAYASHGLNVSDLVLWSPCVRGTSYLRELKALRLGRASTAAERRSPDLEVGGFLMTEETQRELAQLNLEAAQPAAGRVLIVARDDLPADTRLCDAWATRGLAVEQRVLPGYAMMLQEPHRTQVPHAAIADIVGWMSAAIEGRTPGNRPQTRWYSLIHDRQVVACDSTSAAEIRESVFSTDGGLFGVLSEPLGGVEATTPTVLFSNGGATHHIGMSRLYVLLARKLSRAGFRCLRFDLGGLGDSIVDDPARENHPYPPTASRDVEAVIGEMERRHGPGMFIVGGLCSGAHTAFHAALDLAPRSSSIGECILINPVTLYHRRGMSLDAPASLTKRWLWYKRAMRMRSSWSHLVRGDADLSKIATTARERLLLVWRLWAQWFIDRGKPRAQRPVADLDRDLAILASSGRKLTFVFSRFDPGYDTLMMTSGALIRRLRRQGLVKVWSINRTNHTFDTRRPRNELISSLEGHLVASYPTRTGPRLSTAARSAPRRGPALSWRRAAR
jgi:alpha-beta hydrolase superfamily lysophospholipase